VGKLHTLRRAIEREPGRWYCDWKYPWEREPRQPKAARYVNGQWRPSPQPYYRHGPYESFVRHVLKELGYM